MVPAFFDSVLDLIVKTSTDLPPDVRAAMRQARDEEPEATRSSQALAIIAQNIDLAQIGEGVAEATRRGKLRPNSVDSITGANSGDNLGLGTPILHFDQWEQDDEI